MGSGQPSAFSISWHSTAIHLKSRHYFKYRMYILVSKQDIVQAPEFCNVICDDNDKHA
jgi:hypothetical protein